MDNRPTKTTRALFTAPSAESCQPEFRLISNQRRAIPLIVRRWLDMSRNTGWQLSADGAVNRARVVFVGCPLRALKHNKQQQRLSII